MVERHPELENHGVFALNCETISGEHTLPRTLIVLGAPRGGTSAIAGALAATGLFMGGGASGPVFESLALANAIEKGEDTKVRELIGAFDAEHDVWAFKRPGYNNYVGQYHSFFRNPIYLVILRDPVATANRGYISSRLKANFTKKLHHILSIQSRILGFLDSSGAPAVLISYEKLLQSPESTLRLVFAATGLKIGPEALAAAAAFVEPSPLEYLEKSRASRVEGRWTEYSPRKIAGWARYVNRSMDTPPQVVLYQDDRELAVCSAELPVPDREGERRGVECGFEFDLQALGIEPGSGLRLRVKGDIRDFEPPAIEREEDGSLLRSTLARFRRRIAPGRHG